MLHELLKKKAQRIASAAEEEIAVAHSKGQDVFFEDDLEEGSVVKEKPNGRTEKVYSKKVFAA